MNKSIYQSEIIFNLNERLFLNTLAGVKDKMAKERISEHNNPFIWVATHTVWARYNIAGLLGKAVTNPYKGMFEGFKPFDKSMVFPTIEEIKSEWKKASLLLREGIMEVTEEHLSGPAPFKSPIGDDSMGGVITFLAQHESYDIGQMGLLKKFHTKEAMSYN